MPVIEANTTDGYQASGLTSGWDNTHDKTSGMQSVNSTTSNQAAFGARAEYAASRSAYYIVRTFFDFNVQSISANVTAATFSVMTDTYGAGIKNIVVKSGHDPSDTSTSWYTTWLTGLGGTISGWATNSTGVTAFSSDTATAANLNFTDFTLNAAALSHLNSIRGTTTPFKIAVLNYDYDYLDVDPNLDGTDNLQRVGFYYANHGTAANRPHLDLTTEAAAAGYGNDVIGVSSGDTSKVIGVATADMGKVIGVD